MYAEIAWVLVFLGTKVETQVMLDPDYLPDYLSVSYHYGFSENIWNGIEIFELVKNIVLRCLQAIKTAGCSEYSIRFI